MTLARTATRRGLVGVWAVLLTSWLGAPADAQAPTPLRIAVSHDTSSPAGVKAGIHFGAAEIAHTARLVGREVQVVPSADAEEVHARIETTLDVVSISAAAPRAIVGGAPCRLHVRPSAAVRHALLSQWRAAHGDAPADATVVEWHPTLVKFGAAQLNERFMRATATPMDADAWAGWVAVKAAAEALLRAPDDDLCATLVRMALDGHKGQPLRFDEASRRLGQPLYVATSARVLAEVEGQ